MAEFDSLDRREFTVQAALALLGGVTITITGCGGSDYGTSTRDTGNTGSADRVGSISDNHGHSAVITAAQLTAGNALVLNIRGAADHTHTVELSAAEIQRIRSNETVSKQSTTTEAQLYAAHLHTVTFAPSGSGPSY